MTQKEIGGYFGLDDFIHKEYYQGLVALNTARNALLYVLKSRSIKKLYIPFFLCDSILKLCEREGYKYEFYKISRDFMPIFDRDKLHDGEYLYIVNYYGQISNEKLSELQNFYGNNIIFDNVQAFFQKPLNNIDTIYSCRKFFGVPDGAYLATDKRINFALEQDISMHRMKHILGRYEGVSASDYYDDFKNNDEAFENIKLMSMSKLTRNILGALDYESIKAKREHNFKILNEALCNKNALEIISPEGPYAYPFYCKNGMNIKKILAGKKIFVATLWPYALKCNDDTARDYAENILPLPCDQRYDGEDMQRIIDEILRVL